MYVFRDNIFYLNAYWVSFVIMLNERCSLYSEELGSILELNRILINRSKDANSEGLVELPGTSAEIWNCSFHKEKRLLQGWEAFALTSLALFQAEVWEQMDDINTLRWLLNAE